MSKTDWYLQSKIFEPSFKNSQDITSKPGSLNESTPDTISVVVFNVELRSSKLW